MQCGSVESAFMIWRPAVECIYAMPNGDRLDDMKRWAAEKGTRRRIEGGSRRVHGLRRIWTIDAEG